MYEGITATPAQIKQKALEKVKPTAKDVRVVTIKETRNSIVIVTPSADDAKKLLCCDGFKDAGMTVEEPRREGPKILIFDVPKGVGDLGKER